MQIETAKTYVELRPAAEMRSLGWFIRRTLIGITAIMIFAVGGAWLMHASIDAEANVAQIERGQ